MVGSGRHVLGRSVHCILNFCKRLVGTDRWDIGLSGLGRVWLDDMAI